MSCQQSTSHIHLLKVRAHMMDDIPQMHGPLQGMLIRGNACFIVHSCLP